MRVQYNHEATRRVRIAAIGCGSHAIRNIFPTHQYLPIDLVAVCDLNRERADHCARAYGARSAYTDYREMLQREKPDAVHVVTSYDERGHPRYPGIAIDAMNAGAHVWIEKPPAANSALIRQMMSASKETGKFVAVGFKKMFFPSTVKAKEIMSQPEFGALRSITARYPQGLPPLEKRSDDLAMRNFLDHIVHPWSLLRALAGPTESIFVQRGESGASVTAIRFASGAVGSLHMPTSGGNGAPLEDTEIVGAGANIVIRNNIHVTYYPKKAWPEGGYDRGGSYYEPGDNTAALTWEPEFSLGTLYNKAAFLLGYAPELNYFCQCVLDNTAPTVGNLDDALELLQIFEAYRQPDGQVIRIGEKGQSPTDTTKRNRETETRSAVAAGSAGAR